MAYCGASGPSLVDGAFGQTSYNQPKVYRLHDVGSCSPDGIDIVSGYRCGASRIREAQDIVLSIVAIYIVYAVVSPLIGWAIARFAHLDADAGRAVMFSTGTRNSLVVLPLALAAPFDGSLVAGVVVTQTLVELLAELAYIRLVPTLMASRPTRGG